MRPSRFYQLFYRIGRIRYRFQEEGALQTFQLIFQFLLGVICRRETVLIFSRDLDSVPLSGVHDHPEGLSVSLLTTEKIGELLPVSYTSREEVLDRLAEGDLCLVACLQGRIVHYSWLTSKNPYAWEIERTINLKDGQFYLYNCRTVRVFRGHGIYKAVIAKALEESSKRNGRSLTALVTRSNIDSQKAFHAMGFEVIQEIIFRRIGTNRQYKEKFYATAVRTNTTV
jgi:hypothetical protein